jgi:hypothetical protein
VNRKNQTDIVSALTKKSTEIKTTVHRICPGINGTLTSLSQARTRQNRPCTITNCPEQLKQRWPSDSTSPEKKNKTINGVKQHERTWSFYHCKCHSLVSCQRKEKRNEKKCTQSKPQQKLKWKALPRHSWWAPEAIKQHQEQELQKLRNSPSLITTKNNQK